MMACPTVRVTDIAQTPDGYLWVGTYNGLVRFDGLRFVTFDPANTPALAHARVRKLSVDAAGTLWINTFDGSMTSLRQGTFAREWTGAEGLDPDVTLVSSASNQVTFLAHRGFLRRRLQSAQREPAGRIYLRPTGVWGHFAWAMARAPSGTAVWTNIYGGWSAMGSRLCRPPADWQGAR